MPHVSSGRINNIGAFIAEDFYVEAGPSTVFEIDSS
jgi:hypothetical protein